MTNQSFAFTSPSTSIELLNNRQGYRLEKALPWGRSYSEYQQMFALTEADISTSVLDVEQIFVQLHRCLSASPCLEKNYIKSKRQAFDHFLIGDESPNRAFLHCEVALFAGRPTDALQELRESFLILLHQAALKTTLSCWISVELRELPPNSLVAEIVRPNTK